MGGLPYIYALGTNYTGLESWRFDIAYNRFQFKNTDFSRIGPSADRVLGEIKANVDVFALGITKRF